MDQPNPKVCVKWKHKENGNVVKVAPWYEIPEPIIELAADEVIKARLSNDERKIKFGCLVQVGWLLESAQGVFIGVGLKAQEAFEVVT